MSDPEYLFVYGTLRRTAGHPMHQLLAKRAEFVGAGVTRGTLFTVGGYQVLAADCEGEVRGEVYRLHPAATSSLLAALDAYEGESYRRARVRVVLEDGRAIPTWAYVAR